LRSFLRIVGSIGSRDDTRIIARLPPTRPTGFPQRGIFRKNGKSNEESLGFFVELSDLFTIALNGAIAPVRYREMDLTVPGGIEGSPLVIISSPMTTASANFHVWISTCRFGSSTAGRAMQQEHRKSNQTTQP
jgi:hypothetical protein